MKVVLQADDLGIAPEISRAILSAWNNGLIDGFGVMANGIDLEALASSLVPKPPRPLRLAVHFNLTEGYALSEPGQVDWLTYSNGRLRRSFVGLLLGMLFCGPKARAERRRQVSVELRSQLLRVRSLFPSHDIESVDGHEHIQMIPFVATEILDAASREKVPCVRLSREVPYLAQIGDLARPLFWFNILKTSVLNMLSVGFRRAAAKRGIGFCDSIVGVLYTEILTRRRILAGIRAARRSRCRSVEVVVHLGEADPNRAGAIDLPVNWGRRIERLEQTGMLQRDYIPKISNT